MTKKTEPEGDAERQLDGDALFEAVLEGAVLLKRRPSRSPAKMPKAPPKPTAVSKPHTQAPRVWVRAHSTPSLPPAPKNTGGLDKRSAERLRRGRMTIDGRLDLHGHSQADAHRAVHGFITASHQAARRCILIITGKGRARDDFDGSFMPDRDSGVLRRNLPRWLGEASVRSLVLRLETARPQHGGDGAYYVLLRRKR